VKIEIGKTEGVRREIKVTASVPEVAAIRKGALDAVRKYIKVPGFRPGKAPDALVLQRGKREVSKEFAMKLRSQVMHHVEMFHGGGDIVALVELIMPDIQNMVDGDDVTVVVRVDISPEFELPDYNHIPLPAHVELEVSDEEIDEKLRVKLLGEKNLGDMKVLREQARYEIYLQKEFEQHEKRKESVVDFLCSSVNFPLPASLLEREAVDLFMEDAERGNLPISDGDDRNRLLLSYMESAGYKLKVDLIMEAIAKKESIGITKEEMAAYLFAESYSRGIPAEVLLRTLKNDTRKLTRIRRKCLSHKVIATLYERNLSRSPANVSSEDKPFPARNVVDSMLVRKQELRRLNSADGNSAGGQQSGNIEDGSGHSCAGPLDTNPTASVGD
jgi:FKBP-type peptidyl-prolyl cis-trans isomerase (trigger factor)